MTEREKYEKTWEGGVKEEERVRNKLRRTHKMGGVPLDIVRIISRFADNNILFSQL